MGKKVIHNGLIIRGTLASGAGDDLLTIDATTGEVGKISGTPLTTTLAAGSVFLGNASNVATATALSGDVTINSSGVTAIVSGVIVNADVNASAAIAHSKMAALTASRALVSDGSGVVSVSAVTSTELGYVAGVTSAIQTQFTGKQATITGGATTITSSDLTVNRALVSNASGKVAISAVTSTELGYVSGVTSAIQTQLGTKLTATLTSVAEGDIVYYNGTNWVNLARGANGETLQATGTSIQWGAATANGIAAGGTDGQVLAKQSGTDYDADWETLTVASISDLTATAAELNLLDGVTATTTEINYIDGVTSNIQSQLGNKLSTTLPHHAIFVGNVSNIASSLAAGTEGQILSISSGAPTWTTISASGVTTIAALDGTTKSANGAAISGVNLYLQTADDTYPGLVSTGAQTFAGVKTFNEYVIANGTVDEPSFIAGFSALNNHQYNGIGRTVEGHQVYQVIDNTYNNIWRAGTSTTTSNELMRLSGTGSLGIGLTPTAKLHLPAGTATANTAPLKLTTGTALTTPEDGALEYHSSHLYFTVSSTRYQLDGLIGSTGSTDNSILRADGTGGLTAQGSSASIDDSGNVTLGTSAAGTSRSVTAAGSETDVALSYISKGTGSHVFRNVANLSSVVVYPDPEGDGSSSIIHAFGGTLTIGTTAATNAMIFEASNITLTAGGDLTIDDTGTGVDWVATSDSRLKTNINKIDSDVLKKILAIGAIVSEYDRIDNGKHETGFIAQELLEVAPEYVTVPEDPEQMMAVNYAKMTALLFKGFQQLLDK